MNGSSPRIWKSYNDSTDAHDGINVYECPTNVVGDAKTLTEKWRQKAMANGTLMWFA